MATSSAASPPIKSMAETSSSCLTQAFTAAHNFEVINFSLLEGLGSGKPVRSRTFSAGGHDWAITLYPDGITSAHRTAVSAYLSLLHAGGGGDGGAGVRARFSLSLLGKHGAVSRRLHATQTFGAPAAAAGGGGGGGMFWGWNNFVDKPVVLHTLLRLNGDRFTVRCVVTVVTSPKVEDVVAVVVPEPTLTLDLARMLTPDGGGGGADVAFCVGGRTFPAHRCVVAARSPVLRAELFGAMKETAAERVEVADMEPAIFEALLHFIYTDALPDGVDGAGAGENNVAMQHLLVAADRYGLDRLRTMCEARLCRGIDAQTVATTLALAEQHHCAQLRNACLRFIATRGVLGAVMETDGFAHLAASCPLIVLEILDKIASLGIC